MDSCQLLASNYNATISENKMLRVSNFIICLKKWSNKQSISFIRMKKFCVGNHESTMEMNR